MPNHKVLDTLNLVIHYIFQRTYRLQKLMRTVVDISRYRSKRGNAAVLTFSTAALPRLEHDSDLGFGIRNLNRQVLFLDNSDER